MGVTFKTLLRDKKSLVMRKRCQRMRSHIWNRMKDNLRARQREMRIKVLAPALGGSNLGTRLVFGVSLSAPRGGGAWFSRPIMLLFTKLFCHHFPFCDPVAGVISNGAEPILSKSQIWHDWDLFPSFQEDVLRLKTQACGTADIAWHFILFAHCGIVYTLHHIIYIACVEKLSLPLTELPLWSSSWSINQKQFFADLKLHINRSL